jgi:hypothetical protein
VGLRPEQGLVIVALYLGLLDGYLKLATGIGVFTFVRDVLIYAVVVGVLARWVLQRRPLELPPLSLWIVALVGIAAVEAFNPGTRGASGALAGFRQAVEFMPLFALAYITLDSANRIRTLLWILLVIAAANAVVAFIQFNLSPQQFASWGPGYSKRVLGTSDFAIRYFVDATGSARVRPFGLGSDEGAGGVAGLLAIPAGLALFSVARTQLARGLSVGLLGLAVLAVVTSQSRSVVIASVITFAIFVGFTALSRQFLRVMAAVVAVVIVGSFVASQVGGLPPGSLSRYANLTSHSGLLASTSERSLVLPSLVHYFGSIPLGAGLASAGPASTVSGAKSLNAESQANFLIIELGIPGLLCFFGFFASLLGRIAVAVRRVAVPEERILLAALFAPLFGIAILMLTGPVTTAPPTAPYLWVAAGAASRWLYERRRSENRSMARSYASS